MARSHGDKHRAGLGHPRVDPLGPIGVAPGQHGLAQHRIGHAFVQQLRQLLRLARRPVADHFIKRLLGVRQRIDGFVEPGDLARHGQRIEKAQLLLHRFQPGHRLGARLGLAHQDLLDTAIGVEPGLGKGHQRQVHGGQPRLETVERRGGDAQGRERGFILRPVLTIQPLAQLGPGLIGAEPLEGGDHRRLIVSGNDFEDRLVRTVPSRFHRAVEPLHAGLKHMHGAEQIDLGILILDQPQRRIGSDGLGRRLHGRLRRNFHRRGRAVLRCDRRKPRHAKAKSAGQCGCAKYGFCHR